MRADPTAETAASVDAGCTVRLIRRTSKSTACLPEGDSRHGGHFGCKDNSTIWTNGRCAGLFICGNGALTMCKGGSTCTCAEPCHMSEYGRRDHAKRGQSCPPALPFPPYPPPLPPLPPMPPPSSPPPPLVIDSAQATTKSMPCSVALSQSNVALLHSETAALEQNLSSYGLSYGSAHRFSGDPLPLRRALIRRCFANHRANATPAERENSTLQIGVLGGSMPAGYFNCRSGKVSCASHPYYSAQQAWPSVLGAILSSALAPLPCGVAVFNRALPQLGSRVLVQAELRDKLLSRRDDVVRRPARAALASSLGSARHGISFLDHLDFTP